MEKIVKWLNDNGSWAFPLIFVITLFMAVALTFNNPKNKPESSAFPLFIFIIFLFSFDKYIFPKILKTKIAKKHLRVENYTGISCLFSNQKDRGPRTAFFLYIFCIFFAGFITLLFV